MMVRVLFILLFLVSCSSPQKTFHEEGPRTQVFPNGTYQHEIRLKQKEGGERTFSGVVQIKEDLITVVGLSPFGSTLFKITEDRKTKNIKTEIYVEAFKKYEDKVAGFYQVIRELMLLKLGQTQAPGMKVLETESDGAPKKVVLTLEGKEITLSLSNFDEHHIPQNLEVSHPFFQVFVKVVGYNV